MPRVLRFALLSLSVLAVGLIALIYALTWHPAAREPAPLALPGRSARSCSRA